MAFNIADEVAEEAATGVDMTKGEEGGGYTPPANKIANLRFVGYYEIGEHEEDEFGANGQKTGGKRNRNKVHLVFELSGPNHKPNVDKDGNKRPQFITVKETKSLNIKANFFKLFSKMNGAHGNQAKTMAQLLGKEFRAQVYHKTSKIAGKDVVFANLKGAIDTMPQGEGYAIRKAEREDEEGNMVPVVVDPAVTPVSGFLWDRASKEMWDSIYIAGEFEAKYDEKDPTKLIRPAKSKNLFQNLILQAKNFDSIREKIGVAKSEVDAAIPEAEKPARTADPAAAAVGAGADELGDDIPF